VKYNLKDLLTIKNGRDYKIKKYGNVPVYGTGGIITYIDSYIYEGESILLPRKGSLSNIMYVDGKFWTVDTMYWSIVNTHLVYPRFLYYYLSLMNTACRDTGSTLPSMTFDAYYSLVVDIPSLEKQKKILDQIVPLDSKIRENIKINDNLAV